MPLRPMLVRPVMINAVPSLVVLSLGGFVGAILMLSLLYAAPLAGWPVVDVLRSVGAIVTRQPEVSLALGALIVFIALVVVLPLAVMLTWTALPEADTLRGALTNGVVIGVITWLVLGIVCGLAAMLGRVPAAGAVGWMGAGTGIAGAALFAVGALAFGVALALLTLVEQGISAFDTLGWAGFTYAASGPLILGAHRSDRPPRPGKGEQPWRGDR